MKILIILICTFTSQVFAQEKVVYGEDNRLNMNEVTNSLHYEIGRSTAAMISKSKFRFKFGKVLKVRSQSLRDLGVCPTARFAKEPTLAMCSGFLVGDDLLVTAGHCVRHKKDCNAERWVFDYVKGSTSSRGSTIVEIEKENIYKCKKIISRSAIGKGGDDYALIQLDRKVSGRRPLQVRTSGKIEDGAPLVVIGHPTGLPTKVADGANVRSNDKEKYFVANLDTFAGNSGSAVFNSETGIVEGILVRGEQDYTKRGGCKVPKVCANNNCRGEDVTRITNIKELMR